ncbi:hypothetical protein N7493_001152 [Penicillium malachiteum]|uniref:Nudix hydrolase domain-containing protein n=1 Tax=Penicillium malachiteum TaxID=1324776 RepID=A0AAD6HU50_9EURO|nr:hypothetical protein N7493_001152 [Penicillium malachiteum]
MSPTPNDFPLPNPRVGVALFIVRPDGKFVLGRRMGSHGAGTWALPGGHLEHGESFEECAVRETKEETGLDVLNVEYITATNDVMVAEKKHYITIFLKGVVSDPAAEPEILEPNKCAGWRWSSWDEMRAIRDAEIAGGPGFKGEKLFSPVHSLFEQRPHVSL